MKHTPGPWKYALAMRDNAPNYYVVQSARRPIQWRAPPIAICDREEDARLIAALPDLLAALHAFTLAAQRACQSVGGTDPQATSEQHSADLQLLLECVTRAQAVSAKAVQS